MCNPVKESALQYVFGIGVSCLPLLNGKKKPAIDSWKKYQERMPTKEEILEWNDSWNVGIVTGEISRLVVVDCESKDDAIWFYRNRGKSTAIVQSPRGFHFYFRHPGQHIENAVKIPDENGKPRYDIRGDGGYVVAPPSVVEKCESIKVAGTYLWRPEKRLVNVKKLPLFNPGWRPRTNGSGCSSGKYTNGAAYISKIRAISGQGGHKATWQAVCVLRDAGLREVDALAELIKWNETNAEPPWSLPELLHKVKDAYAT